MDYLVLMLRNVDFILLVMGNHWKYKYSQMMTRFVFFFFFLHCETWRSLVPQIRIEPRAMAVKAPSPNYWTSRQLPDFHLKIAM